MCRWKTHEEIVSNHNLIIYPRKLSGKDLKLKEANEKVHSVTTYIENVPVLEISATYIRNCIQNNKSIKYLVPDSVIEHIGENGLYKK
jgi:nicotinate-nucleotide adenylyltransferase